MWLAKTALALATTLGVLQGIPVDDEQTEVPRGASLLMTNAKHDFRELAQDVLKSQPGNARVIAPAVRNAIVAALASEGIGIGDELQTEQYGSVVSIDVIAPEGHRNVLAVVVELSIPCGSDAALFVFRHDADWRLVYEREEDDYEAISGALGSFTWKISPPDAQGRFLVVTSSITPWCSSSWHQLRYQVDRIEPGRSEPVPIDRAEFTSYGWDAELEATANSYSIDFAGSSFDPSVLVRPYVLRYVVDGNQPVRVDPIAGSPRDFVEELLSMSGDVAARWSDVEADALDAARPGRDGYDELGPAARCADDRWQVRIDHYDETGFESFVSTYFIVTKSKGTYRLREITHEPAGDCAASDTIASRE